MLYIAKKNAEAYQIPACYVQANCMEMPFDDESFDTVISNGSLHEWETPVRVFNEIYRILRSGGRYCITDLRRDVHPLKKAMVYSSTNPKQMRPGLLSSLNAAYTIQEVTELLRNSLFIGCSRNRRFLWVVYCRAKMTILPANKDDSQSPSTPFGLYLNTYKPDEIRKFGIAGNRMV